MTVALVDCNGFYASCEKVFRPDLLRRPVVVLSNNDGCVVAMSREARNLGIPRGIPFFKIRALAREKGIEVFSSNYALYADLSRRVMDILSTRVPVCEVYSIDEAFLVLDHLPDPPPLIARGLRDEIHRCLGIPVSVGLGPTKVLAKIAAGIAKNRADGLFAVGPDAVGTGTAIVPDGIEPDIGALLARTPVENVWGISDRLAGRLKDRGVTTARHLAEMNDADARALLSLTGLRVVWELRGVPSIALEQSAPPKKGIMCSRSFGRPVTGLEELLEAAALYAATAVRKLRAQRSVCRYVDVWLTTDRYRTGERQYSGATVVALEQPTDYPPDLVAAARRGLKSLYRDGFRYRKVAVFLSGIEGREGRQIGLFDIPDPRRAAVMAAADRADARYGPGTVYCASSRPTGSWEMRRESLSPAYTSRWSDLPIARTG